MFFEFIIVNIVLFIFFYGILYFLFYTTLCEDLQINGGKGKLKKRNNNTKNLIKKYFFLDVKEFIVPWHYACFWLYLVCSLVLIILLNLYYFLKIKLLIVSCVFLALFLISMIPAEISYGTYWLNKHHKLRTPKHFKKYRYNKIKRKD